MTLVSVFTRRLSLTLSANPGKYKLGWRTRFSKKIQSEALHQLIYLCLCSCGMLLCFGLFWKSRSVTVPKIGIVCQAYISRSRVVSDFFWTFFLVLTFLTWYWWVTFFILLMDHYQGCHNQILSIDHYLQSRNSKPRRFWNPNIINWTIWKWFGSF